MGKPAARVGDMHICPMVTPNIVPIPHVGGPITGPGVPTILIGGQPAAVLGDMCVCVGPPDVVMLGSTGVFYGGKPAARMGDATAHGGVIVAGLPTVLIGEVMPGTPLPPAILELAKTNPPLAQIVVMMQAAQNGTPFCEECEQAKKEMEK